MNSREQRYSKHSSATFTEYCISTMYSNYSTKLEGHKILPATQGSDGDEQVSAQHSKLMVRWCDPKRASVPCDTPNHLLAVLHRLLPAISEHTRGSEKRRGEKSGDGVEIPQALAPGWRNSKEIGSVSTCQKSVELVLTATL